jgi:hypothetical protein
VATIALGIAAVQPADHQRNTDEQSALRKAALDWVELLLTIRGDPLKGNTQMEEMKRRTTDPLQSRFEDSMSPYFQDFAPWSAKPLQITSINGCKLHPSAASNHHRRPRRSYSPLPLALCSETAATASG